MPTDTYPLMIDNGAIHIIWCLLFVRLVVDCNASFICVSAGAVNNNGSALALLLFYYTMYLQRCHHC